MTMLLAEYVFNPIVDGGLIDDILTAIGLVTDFDVTNDYGFLYALFCISLSLIFVVIFIVLLLRCFSSLVKGARL